VGRRWFMSSSSSGSLWLDSPALGNVAVAVVTAVRRRCRRCRRGGGYCRWVAQVAHIPWERGGAAAAASLLVRELGRC
jgi:chloramphenicol 3-O-phosphotransferase